MTPAQQQIISQLKQDILAMKNECKFITSYKQALDYTYLCAYDILSNPVFQREYRPYGMVNIAKSVVTELQIFKDKGKAEQLWEVTFQLLAAYKEFPPFTNIAEILYSDKHNNALAQFLTPQSLALKLAPFIIGKDEWASMESKENITVGDLTGCGEGACILAQLQTFYEVNPALVAKANVSALDLDFIMTIKTVVQLELSTMLHGIFYKSLTVYNADIIKDYSFLGLNDKFTLYESIPFIPWKANVLQLVDEMKCLAPIQEKLSA